MRLQFAQPLFLLAAIPLLLHALWMARRLTLLSHPRRVVAVLLRLLVLLLLVGALAGMRLARESKDLTVIYAFDLSDSIGQTQRALAGKLIQKTLGEMGRHDQAGIVVFGKNAAVEQSPDTRVVYNEPKAVVDRSRTNIAAGLELAKACFAGDAQRRIVLLSDGNQNAGDALETARSAAAAGIPIDVFPLKFENRNDVIVEKAVVENRVNLNEPFDLKVIATAPHACKGKLSIHQDGKLIGEPFEVDLQAGRKNLFTVTTRVHEAGFHNFEIQLDVPGDLIPENNRAFAFTYGEGEPRVLYVDGDDKPDPVLPALLQNEKINVVVTGPGGLPHSLRDFEGYDSIIFNNVPASAVTGDQMKMIERAVHDMGLGFMMIGGENSFGAGGYHDSPIERILPVEMEIKNDKIMPQGALVTIMHTVEIPDGQFWAEQTAHAALDVLSAHDLMGVIYYFWQGGETWLFPLQEVGDKKRLHNLLNGIQPGDMPSFDRTLQMAYDGLLKCGASVKHIVVISDGDPQTTNRDLLKKIREAHITISTVCINPHSSRDSDVMNDLATLGGGSFYDVTSYGNLPQIFIKEAATVRKSLLIEEKFTPREKQYSPLLTGTGPAYRELRGYVGTTAKPLADVPLVTHHDDPLFAHWRHGLGKTAAFTSDAKPRWAAAWMGWPQLNKFWSQVVRWTLRTGMNRNYQVHMDISGARGKVVVDAVDAANHFRNLLQIKGRIITPALEPLDVTLNQTAPGRYEADFDASQPGAYMLGALAGEAATPDRGDLITGGATLSYSPEFENSKSNDALLYQLADLSGGRVLDAASPVFFHDRRVFSQAQPIWPQLLLAAILLFLADVFTRRVLIAGDDLLQGLAYVRQRLRAFSLFPTQAPATGPTDQLLQVKQAVRERESRDRPALDATWREELFSAGERKPTDEAPGDSPLSQAREEANQANPPASHGPQKPTSPAPPAATDEPAGFTGQLLRARKKTRTQIRKQDEGEKKP